MGSTVLLGLTTVLYLGTAVSLMIEGKPSMSLVFVAYALANVGLILVSRGHP
jgi:hypothetical protein